MRQITGCVCLCLGVSLVGCSSAPKLTAWAPKPKKSTQTVGSAGFSTSKKLKNPAKIHLAYGAWHEQSGDYPQARISYQKVLEKSPKDLEALLGLARIDQIYERHEECDQQLEKALKYHPNDARVFVAIGKRHAAQKEWPEALENMRHAQKLAPFDPMYEYHLAVVEARAGEVQSAIEHFTRSVGAAEAHFNVGFILNEQGNAAEAEMHLAKALKLKPDFKQAQTVLAELRNANAEGVLPASFNEGTKKHADRD